VGAGGGSAGGGSVRAEMDGDVVGGVSARRLGGIKPNAIKLFTRFRQL
jgi:hypothetical protein